MKKYLLLMFVSILSFSLLACSNNSDTSSNQQKKSVKRYSLATGGTSGTYYPVGSGIASIVTKHVDGIEMNAESTGGSVANTKMAQNKETDFFLGAAATVKGAMEGLPRESFPEPITDIRSVTALYSEVFQFVTLANSGITSIHDLKGKKVAVGKAGSGTERNAKIFLEYYGITYDDINEQFQSFGEAVTSLKDRQLDVAIVASGLPTAAIVDAATTLDVRFLPMDEAIAKKITDDNMYYKIDRIKAGTYNGQDKDILAIGTPALLNVRSDIPDQDVYNILTKFYDNIDVLRDIHAQGKNIKLETALAGVSIPLHPGAVKYYKEKGMEIPARLN